MFKIFNSLSSAKSAGKSTPHPLQEAYEQVEAYLLRADLEMTDMAIREYQLKISQSQLHYTEALTRLDILIEGSDKQVATTAKERAKFARDELVLLLKYDKKIAILKNKLEQAFDERKKVNTPSPTKVSAEPVAPKVSPTSTKTGFFTRIKKRLFSRQREDHNQIHDFKEAILWIDTYITTHEYDTAMIASRELLLKINTGITYYLSAEKKVTALASSNIPTIAKASNAKLKEIKKNIKLFTEQENILQKNITKIERLKSEYLESQTTTQVLEAVKIEITAIQNELSKSNFVEALHMARKLASAHGDLKIVTDILQDTQKRYNKGYLKEEKINAEKTKKERFFREAGLTKPEWIDETSDLKTLVSTNPVKEYYDRFITSYRKRKDYQKKQKTLHNIEQLLVKTGSITKVDNIDAEGEILSIMESGLTKNISDFKIDGYEFFGKILGKDKIVGDTFGHFRDGMKTVFYFGDATGHGIQAGFTVSQLTKIFYEQMKKRFNFADLFVILNNELKSKLKGRVFITGVFLEHDSTNGQLRFIGAGHDPMYVYRARTQMVEKIIPGGLAMGVRNIVNTNSIKVRDMLLDDGDFLMGYTDGIIEARNSKGELFGLERLAKAIWEAGKKSEGSLNRVFQEVFQSVREFMGNEVFLDDVSVFIFKRNSTLDVLSNKADIDKMIRDFDLSQRTITLDLRGRTRAEAQEELQKERKRLELKTRLHNMESLYKLGEYGKLKQEVTLCYKSGFVHPKMTFYLEKIIKNEDKTKVLKQEDRLQKEYDKLRSLLSKGEYSIVLRSTVDILYKNGNI